MRNKANKDHGLARNDEVECGVALMDLDRMAGNSLLESSFFLKLRNLLRGWMSGTAHLLPGMKAVAVRCVHAQLGSCDLAGQPIHIQMHRSIRSVQVGVVVIP